MTVRNPVVQERDVIAPSDIGGVTAERHYVTFNSTKGTFIGVNEFFCRGAVLFDSLTGFAC